MPNNWFQFKQFTIYQDQCAMKVSTDACIQGAWAALLVPETSTQHILDIGTGTGLLTLMIAQQLPNAKITAIEINEEAFRQAEENFKQSPWSNNLAIQHQSLQEYAGQHHVTATEAQYDLIICNPPFFHNQLPSIDTARNNARHGSILSNDDLAKAAVQLLKAEGKFCVMYPEREWDAWDKIAQKEGLYPSRWLHIRPNDQKQPNRTVGIYSKKNNLNYPIEELTIYSAPNTYTEAFAKLMRPYYFTL